MKCYTIVTWEDGSHNPAFHLLVEDDYALVHALEVIIASMVIDYFEIDMEDGGEFYDKVFNRLYSGLKK